MSLSHQIKLTSYVTLYHSTCILLLSISNLAFLQKMWSGGCVVWLFDYPRLQSLCLIINIVKAKTKANLNCPN